MTPLQRQQLLYFCTGSAVLPVMNDRRDPDQGNDFIFCFPIYSCYIVFMLHLQTKIVCKLTQFNYLINLTLKPHVC